MPVFSPKQELNFPTLAQVQELGSPTLVQVQELGFPTLVQGQELGKKLLMRIQPSLFFASISVETPLGGNFVEINLFCSDFN